MNAKGRPLSKAEDEGGTGNTGWVGVDEVEQDVDRRSAAAKVFTSVRYGSIR